MHRRRFCGAGTNLVPAPFCCEACRNPAAGNAGTGQKGLSLRHTAFAQTVRRPSALRRMPVCRGGVGEVQAKHIFNRRFLRKGKGGKPLRPCLQIASVYFGGPRLGRKKRGFIEIPARGASIYNRAAGRKKALSDCVVSLMETAGGICVPEESPPEGFRVIFGRNRANFVNSPCGIRKNMVFY